VDKDTIGRWGEHLAAQWLRKNGRKILYRNYRAPQGGEVDIVARHGDTLTFVEVKTRTSDALGRPGEAVTPAKEKLILRGANAWLKLLHRNSMKTRCDVIEVVLRDGQRADIRIIEGAFRVEKF
jgi:putative endonuclease